MCNYIYEPLGKLNGKTCPTDTTCISEAIKEATNLDGLRVGKVKCVPIGQNKKTNKFIVSWNVEADSGASWVFADLFDAKGKNKAKSQVSTTITIKSIIIIILLVIIMIIIIFLS